MPKGRAERGSVTGNGGVLSSLQLRRAAESAGKRIKATKGTGSVVAPAGYARTLAGDVPFDRTRLNPYAGY